MGAAVCYAAAADGWRRLGVASEKRGIDRGGSHCGRCRRVVGVEGTEVWSLAPKTSVDPGPTYVIITCTGPAWGPANYGYPWQLALLAWLAGIHGIPARLFTRRRHALPNQLFPLIRHSTILSILTVRHDKAQTGRVTVPRPALPWLTSRPACLGEFGVRI